MRFIVIAAVAIVILISICIGSVLLIGSRLPIRHEVPQSIFLPLPPDEVFAIIRDFERASEWRDDVSRVEIVAPVDGRFRFREHTRHGAITYEVASETEGRLLVTRIVDEDLGFSGSWTHSLAQQERGTLLTTTERGEVPGALFRFMSHYVFGHGRTIQTYQSGLARHVPLISADRSTGD